MSVTIQTGPFDAQAEADALRQGDLDVGAVVTFVGTVRDLSEGDAVATLELEHYPGMTERSLEAIVDEARARFDVRGVRVIHRVGALAPGEPIVFVAVTSAHRGAAFDACRFVMDYLKTRAPFWKKERTPAGDRWVEARTADDDAAARWSTDASKLA